MAANSASRILELLAENRGMRVEQIWPESRLLHDLGMDGDDAVDFFSDLQNEFGTDFAVLDEHWSDHFGGEHLTLAGFIGIVVSVFMGFAAAEIASVGHPLLWAFGIGAIWLFAFGAWPLRGPSRIPILVAEVIASVQAGKWLKHYDDRPRRERTGVYWGQRPRA
jgi:acyl carrier protein